jgi:excisionase family DNA binding protein
MVKVSITPGSFDEVHYTTSEAAKLLGVSADTVKCYCHRKQLGGRKLLGKTGPWFVPKSAIEEYKRAASDLGRPKKCQQNGHKIGRRRKAKSG